MQIFSEGSNWISIAARSVWIWVVWVWQMLSQVLLRWVVIAVIFLFLMGGTLALFEARNFQRRVAVLTDESGTAREVLLVIDTLYRNQTQMPRENPGLPLGAMALKLDAVETAANELKQFRLAVAAEAEEARIKVPTADEITTFEQRQNQAKSILDSAQAIADSGLEGEELQNAQAAVNAAKEEFDAAKDALDQARQAQIDAKRAATAEFGKLTARLNNDVASLNELLKRRQPALQVVQSYEQLSQSLNRLLVFVKELKPISVVSSTNEPWIPKGGTSGEASFQDIVASVSTLSNQLMRDAVAAKRTARPAVAAMNALEHKVALLSAAARRAELSWTDMDPDRAQKLLLAAKARQDQPARSVVEISEDLLSDTSEIANALNRLDDGMAIAIGIAAHVTRLDRTSARLQQLKEKGSFVYERPEGRVVGSDAASEFGKLVGLVNSSAQELFQTLGDLTPEGRIAEVVAHANVPDPRARARTIWQEFNAMGRFHTLLHPFSLTAGTMIDLSAVGVDPKGLATLSERALMLLFVFVMGAIGSLIYITKYQMELAIQGGDVLQRKARPLSWLIFRPVFGIVIALAVFLLVDAGQFALTGGGGSTGPLNLAIFSVIALFAGLLSWQALEMIESKGSSWFQSQARRDLWATGLANALRNAGKSETECANHIGRSVEQVQRWTMFRDKVVPEMQDRLTAMLERPREEMFSEREPRMRAEQTALWGKGLASAMDAAKLETEAVAEMMDISAERLQSWIDCRRRVPPAAQWRLVSILERSHGQLFDARHQGQDVWATGLRGALMALGENHDCAWLAKQLDVGTEEVQRWAELEAPVPKDMRANIVRLLKRTEDALFSDELTGIAPDRWAVGLREAMSVHGQRADELAALMDVDVNQIRAWMELDRPVRAATQKRLESALVEADQDDLFKANRRTSAFAWARDELGRILAVRDGKNSAFADELDVLERRVERWLARDLQIPPATQKQILTILEVSAAQVFSKFKEVERPDEPGPDLAGQRQTVEKTD